MSNPLRTLFARRRTSPRNALLVTNGRVACPRSTVGDIDADTCFSCPAFDGFVQDASGKTWMRCRPTAGRTQGGFINV